jgi:hypothetical protein
MQEGYQEKLIDPQCEPNFSYSPTFSRKQPYFKTPTCLCKRIRHDETNKRRSSCVVHHSTRSGAVKTKSYRFTRKYECEPSFQSSNLGKARSTQFMKGLMQQSGKYTRGLTSERNRSSSVKNGDDSDSRQAGLQLI